METAQWFCDQLAQGLADFEHALEQVPADRLYVEPPPAAGEDSLGEWPAARHLFHLAYYEQHTAIPALHYWIGEPYPHYEGPDEDAAWESAREIERGIAMLRETREWQMELIPRVLAETWRHVRHTGWGDVSLRWAMTKTIQHTHEHINGVLRLALFWEMTETHAQQAEQGTAD